MTKKILFLSFLGLLTGLMIEAKPALSLAVSVLAQSDSPSSTTTDQSAEDDMISVAPIQPLNREEVDVVQPPDIYNEGSEEFQYFRKNLDKETLSTAQKEREAMQKKRQELAKMDPMDKPAADGSKFVDIYSPANIYSDQKPFIDLTDPDERYSEYEKNGLAKTIQTLEMIGLVGNMWTASLPQSGQAPVSKTATATPSFTLPAAAAGGPGTLPPPAAGAPTGPIAPTGPGAPGTPSNQAQADEKIDNKYNDTEMIFRDIEEVNSFAEAKAVAPNAETELDLFKADREFVPAPVASQPGSPGGPAMMASPYGNMMQTAPFGATPPQK